MNYSRATLVALAFVLVCVDAGILRRPNMHNDSPEAAEKKPPKPAGDLASFFAKNDMSQYSDAFFKNGFENVQDIIDAELSETDFKELGVQKMRDRKTLLNVIASGESAAPTLPTPNPSPRKQAPESDDDQKLRKTERKKQARELVDAVLAGDIPLVKALLEAGVKVDAKTKVNRGMKWTPLRWAALGNMTEQGYKKTEFDNMQGLTVVNQNATDMLQVLVDAGADTNYIDEAGQCALHTASFIGRADIIKFLLDNGAQPDIIGKDGLSPMHWAANKNQPESVTALATGGATVDVQDGRYSSSPLFMAADRQHVAAAEALLLAGADPNLGLPEDIVEAKIHVVKGVTPMMVAVSPFDPEVKGAIVDTAKMLLQHGGDPFHTDVEGMNTFDRSYCPVKNFPRKTPEEGEMADKLCRFLEKYQDKQKDAAVQESEVGKWIGEKFDGNFVKYARLLHDSGYTTMEDLKRIRNEMDLLDLGFRRKKPARKFMETLMEVEEWKDHYDSLEEEDLPALDFSKFPSIRNKKKKQDEEAKAAGIDTEAATTTKDGVTTKSFKPNKVEEEEDEDSEVLVLSSGDFASTVEAEELMMVEFYAPWCGHCKTLKPKYDHAADMLAERGIPLAKVDGDANPGLLKKFAIESFPTMLIFKNGDLSNPTRYEGGHGATEIAAEMVGKKEAMLGKAARDDRDL